MKSELVYDWVIRIFHWTFVLLFLSSYLIATYVDDEELLYSYHMLSGLLLLIVIMIRLIWGIFGTKYAKLNHLPLKPKLLLEYFKSLFLNKNHQWAGHNPASSWAAIVMVICAILLGVSGILMSLDIAKETVEDAHEFLANALLFVSITHICGIIFHTIRLKDPIGLSMITGQKQNLSKDEGITNSRPFWGLGFLFTIILCGFYLQKNFNPITKELKLFQSTLVLGEPEED